MKNIFGVYGGLTVSNPGHTLTIENLQASIDKINKVSFSPGELIYYPIPMIYGYEWYEYPEYEELRKSKLFVLVNT
jgi:hypothetical protein